MGSADIMVSGNLALVSRAAEPARTPERAPEPLTVVNGAVRTHVIARDRQLWAPDAFSARAARPAAPVSRVRAIAAGIALALLAFALLFACTAARANVEDAAIATAARIEVTVAPGDSLWSIAEAHPIEGLDTARTVELIRSWNELPSSMLSAGSVLVVPDGR